MTPQFDFKNPEKPAEADSLVGVASSDLFAALVRRHNLAVDDLTETQLAEAIRQALPDFRRLVHVSGQQVIYVPYQEADRWKALYHELLWSVESVHEGETRHETALRYIRERETFSCAPASDSSANVERTHGARLESEGKEIKGLKHRCCDAACSESSFWDDEFVEWNRIIRAEGLNPCALTRDQTVWALRELLDWTHDRIQGKCPQKTELSREGCLLRASVIEGWIEALSEKPHTPQLATDTSGQISQATC